MTTRVVGKTEIVFCDQCDKPCEHEVLGAFHYKKGKEDEAVVVHFCSSACRDDYDEFPERIEEQVEKRVREEFNILHKQVCPKCQERIRRIAGE